MNTEQLEKQSQELKAAAKYLERLVEQQIALFTHEKEEHEKTIEKLNSMIYLLNR